MSSDIVYESYGFMDHKEPKGVRHKQLLQVLSSLERYEKR